jgi:hypothetical protein
MAMDLGRDFTHLAYEDFTVPGVLENVGGSFRDDQRNAAGVGLVESDTPSGVDRTAPRNATLLTSAMAKAV